MNTLNSVLEGSVLTGMLFFSFYVIAGELLSVLIRIGSKYRTYAVILIWVILMVTGYFLDLMINGIMNYWATFIIWALITTVYFGIFLGLSRHFQETLHTIRVNLEDDNRPTKRSYQNAIIIVSGAIALHITLQCIYGLHETSQMFLLNPITALGEYCVAGLLIIACCYGITGIQVRALQIGFMLQAVGLLGICVFSMNSPTLMIHDGFVIVCLVASIYTIFYPMIVISRANSEKQYWGLNILGVVVFALDLGYLILQYTLLNVGLIIANGIWFIALYTKIVHDTGFAPEATKIKVQTPRQESTDEKLLNEELKLAKMVLDIKSEVNAVNTSSTQAQPLIELTSLKGIETYLEKISLQELLESQKGPSAINMQTHSEENLDSISLESFFRINKKIPSNNVESKVE